MQAHLTLQAPAGHPIHFGRVPLLYEHGLFLTLSDIVRAYQQLAEQGQGANLPEDEYLRFAVPAVLDAMPQVGLCPYRQGWQFVLQDKLLFSRLFLMSEGLQQKIHAVGLEAIAAMPPDQRKEYSWDGGDIAVFHREALLWPEPGKKVWFHDTGDALGEWIASLAAGGDFAGAFNLMTSVSRQSISAAIARHNEAQVPLATRKQKISGERIRKDETLRLQMEIEKQRDIAELQREVRARLEASAEKKRLRDASVNPPENPPEV